MKLTPAQRYAIKIIAAHPDITPQFLGKRMMDRPGVEEKRRGGNRTSPQGLGRIGGTMMVRLEKMGLVELRYTTRGQWHPTKARLTALGQQEAKAE